MNRVILYQTEKNWIRKDTLFLTHSILKDKIPDFMSFLPSRSRRESIVIIKKFDFDLTTLMNHDNSLTLRGGTKGFEASSVTRQLGIEQSRTLIHKKHRHS
ncbi:hypothetical protein AVEN_130604-1 [Araneus ventricosus]|uniref:Uncharacterized protein n=1 Tax=Araneus ventricosus TaxID=182803 RepID=A0A4Y2D131_ARAVE|nr:hypothetical protein AVEN_78860-1 [Araneus ventricosus]GBM09736.1 hypothetical protein AVEN_130604-1 [Araneus ventricosus]